MSYPSRQLQLFERNESDIQDFFEVYGPSARDCFASCHDLGSFNHLVRRKVAEMGWDTLTKALTRGEESLDLDEGFHKVVLVEPLPEDADRAQIRIVTKAVNQILWEHDSIYRGRNHRQLYRTLRLAKRPSGKLFEPAFHDLCVKGTTLTIYPMTQKSQGPVNHIFVNYPRTNAEP